MFEIFMAKRLFHDTGNKDKTSMPAIRVAVFGVFIGLTVIILSIGIIIGFKHEVKNKITGFSSNINVTSFNYSDSYETDPIEVSDSLVNLLYSLPGIDHIQKFSTKPGMIKTDDQFQGIVLKGVGAEYDTEFLSAHITDGKMPSWGGDKANDSIIISETISKKLLLDIGDKIYTYFVNDNIRARRFIISGIYETGFSDYDNLFIIADIRTVNRLNAWNADQYGGIEIKIRNDADAAEVADNIFNTLSYHTDKYGKTYFVQTIEEMNPSIFSWLDLLDMNVWIIFIIVLAVTGFSIISGLLIIILERTSMIGVLKALGASNKSVRKIFLYFAACLVAKGMLWGNIIGIGFGLLQYKFHFLKLDPTVYYVDYVPVRFDIPVLILTNIAVFCLSILFMIGPSFITTHINPATSMRYD